MNSEGHSGSDSCWACGIFGRRLMVCLVAAGTFCGSAGSEMRSRQRERGEGREGLKSGLRPFERLLVIHISPSPHLSRPTPPMLFISVPRARSAFSSSHISAILLCTSLDAASPPSRILPRMELASDCLSRPWHPWPRIDGLKSATFQPIHRLPPP